MPWIDDGSDIPDDYHNVTQNFYMLNLWGFCNFMIPFGLMCLSGCMYCLCRSKECTEIIMGLGMGCVALSYLSQLITMCVMRYRHAGRVCSGDYSEELHFWSPLKGDGTKPFLHLNGSWLFYNTASQLYAGLMAVAGISFVVGNDD